MTNYDGQPPSGSPSGPYSVPSQQAHAYLTDDERSAVVMSWLGTFLLGIFSPVIAYNVKKNSRFVRHHAAVAINLSITILIAWVAALSVGALISGVIFLLLDWPAIFFVVFMVLMLVMTVLSVISLWAVIAGAIKGNRGESFQIPYLIRLVDE